VANYLEFSAEDGEAERKKALSDVVDLGQAVWVKVRARVDQAVWAWARLLGWDLGQAVWVKVRAGVGQAVWARLCGPGGDLSQAVWVKVRGGQLAGCGRHAVRVRVHGQGCAGWTVWARGNLGQAVWVKVRARGL
jgi:hypothetical protein